MRVDIAQAFPHQGVLLDKIQHLFMFGQCSFGEGFQESENFLFSKFDFNFFR